MNNSEHGTPVSTAYAIKGVNNRVAPLVVAPFKGISTASCDFPGVAAGADLLRANPLSTRLDDRLLHALYRDMETATVGHLPKEIVKEAA
ncbi:hypothetical protein [Yoonia maritima]|uniref:hypothetical protein n=1 Tax=Yoonia maritima TaxID=1435347 RepID=UPI000D1045E3|nr:hypothetical protein [Yoonia maritima]